MNTEKTLNTSANQSPANQFSSTTLRVKVTNDCSCNTTSLCSCNTCSTSKPYPNHPEIDIKFQMLQKTMSLETAAIKSVVPSLPALVRRNSAAGGIKVNKAA